MNKLLFLIPLSILLSSLLVVSFLIKNKLEYSVSGNKSFPLERPMETTFHPTHSGLNIIVLRLQNPQLMDYNTYTVSLLGEAGNTIKKLEFNAQNVGDPSNIRLQFDPVSNSTDIRTLRIDPVSGGKLHVYIDDSDQISFTAYYRASTFQISWPQFSDLAFFAVWLTLLVGLFVTYLKWQKSS
mgnify:CR=1 FL=1